MAFNQVTATSLTPSRPAPAAPVRRGNDIGNALASSGYGSSFSVGMSSPSGSSYGPSYSGIGASPIRNTDMFSGGSEVIRAGVVAVKEDGIVSWLWRPKWLVLKEGSLSIHKSEVSPDHSDRLLPLPQSLLRMRRAATSLLSCCDSHRTSTCFSPPRSRQHLAVGVRIWDVAHTPARPPQPPVPQGVF